MKAFISYSHQDSAMLEILHKHLAQLKRDNLITTWTDQEITAGTKLDQTISEALSSSKLFIAMLSHEYIASNYCYEKEFQKAQEMEQQGKILIVPVILEPCDWLNTPFKEFKALPRDGKPISTWENKNTAFLEVVQELRKLIQYGNTGETSKAPSQVNVPLSRNYRVQKDFDAIAKIEFTEAIFKEVKETLKRYIPEVEQLDNIKTRIITDGPDTFECLLSNRNKAGAESKLTVSIATGNAMFGGHRSNDMQITCTIKNNKRPSNKNYQLAWDAYQMFWVDGSIYGETKGKVPDAKTIADTIWNDWLEGVGIS